MSEAPTPRQQLDAADELARKARSATSYVARYLAAWAYGSLAMGLASWLLPLVNAQWYTIAVFGLWVVFVVGLAVYFTRIRTVESRGQAMKWGVLWGSVPWALTAGVLGAVPREPWFIKGAPFLIAGIVCYLGLRWAAGLAEREAR